MSAPALLAVSALAKAFDGRSVLGEVSFEVAAGEMVGLVGPNGVGKTTLLRCLVGLVRADGGRITLEGRDAAADFVRTRARVGYLPGETSLYAQMTGRETLEFGLAFHERIDREVLDLCLQTFALPLERRVRTYSAGMKRMLALTVALAPDVPLFILDEPDRGLDPGMRAAMRGLLRRLKERGRTFLLSTHHLDELERLADRHIFLVGGRIAAPAEVERARRRLELRVHVRFGARRPPPPPPGVVELAGGGVERTYECAGVEARAELLARLAPLAPERLDYGRAPLAELYDLLVPPRAAEEAAP